MSRVNYIFLQYHKFKNASDRTCQLGTCTLEGDCECSRGYEWKKNFTIKKANFEKLQDVKSLEAVPQQCTPICLPRCPPNSKCLLPRICECNDGYHANGDKQCVQ